MIVYLDKNHGRLIEAIAYMEGDELVEIRSDGFVRPTPAGKDYLLARGVSAEQFREMEADTRAENVLLMLADVYLKERLAHFQEQAESARREVDRLRRG